MFEPVKIIEHKIKNCQYRLFEGVPLPKPKGWRRGRKAGSPLTRREKNTGSRSQLNNIVRYLQWAYPEDKKLQKVDWKICRTKIVKDAETKSPRFIQMLWDTGYGREKKKYKCEAEIPHWNFNNAILEEKHDE
jgi:hypothetical protein